MVNKVCIRDYSAVDEEQVLKLFDANSPEYFAAEERPAFINYLRNEIEHYFVMEIGDEILGAGGVNTEDHGRIGIISWGMIDPAWHSKLLGSLLLRHRIFFLQGLAVEKIRVRTSQLTAGFFIKHGFSQIEVVSEYWAKGFDLYSMELNKKL